MADWIKIKNEYISTNISYRKLAEKYSISIDTVKKRAAREHWKELGTEMAPKVHQKTVEKVSEIVAATEATRISKMLILSDKLLAKLERATEELESSVVINKTKTRVIEYEDKKARGKPSKEIITEKEDKSVVQSLVDRQGLQQLSSALKNIKDTVSAVETPKADTSLMQALIDVVKGGTHK